MLLEEDLQGVIDGRVVGYEDGFSLPFRMRK